MLLCVCFLVLKFGLLEAIYGFGKFRFGKNYGQNTPEKSLINIPGIWCDIERVNFNIVLLGMGSSRIFLLFCEEGKILLKFFLLLLVGILY